jgi:hypothetical protein
MQHQVPEDQPPGNCRPPQEIQLDFQLGNHPVNSEGEAHIKAGEAIQVFTGDVTTGFPAGVKFPEGSDVTIIEL